MIESKHKQHIADLAKDCAKASKGMKQAFADEDAAKTKLVEELALIAAPALPEIVGPIYDEFKGPMGNLQARTMKGLPAFGITVISTRMSETPLKFKLLILLSDGSWMGHVSTVLNGPAYTAQNIELTHAEVAKTWSPIAISFGLAQVLERESEGREKARVRSERAVKRYRAIADLLEVQR